MAIVDHLLSPESPLHENKPWSPPDVVYVSLYDRIFIYFSMKAADVAYVAIATVSATLALANLGRFRVKAFFLAFIGAPLGLISGVISANVVATIMWFIHREMSW
jgi:hypothetical protein